MQTKLPEPTFQNNLPTTKVFQKQYHCHHTKKNERPRNNLQEPISNEISEQFADGWGIIQFAEMEDHKPRQR
jgi:hypothetical protein